MKKSIIQLIALPILLLMASLPCLADGLSSGYYRIVSSQYQRYIIEKSDGTLATVPKSATPADETIWKVTKVMGGVSFRNACSGHYITEQKQNSRPFTCGTSKEYFDLTGLRGKYLIYTEPNNILHCAATQAYDVVKWHDSNSTASLWTFEPVDITDKEVAALHEEYAKYNFSPAEIKALNKALLQVFTDATCSQLQAKYQNMTDPELLKQTGKLPTFIQQIALKVKNNWWTDTDKSPFADPNKYAREFRCQRYEPYSDAFQWFKKLICYAFSYMGNPTGIMSQAGSHLYIFVGGEVPSGSTLRLAEIKGPKEITSRDAGIELHQGLNIVKTTEKGSAFYINYVVDTHDQKKKIADYPTLDIHIEGGYAQGYYKRPETHTAEEDAKYCYLLGGAMDSTSFVIRGHHSILSLSKESLLRVPAWQKSIYNSIVWFDHVAQWENALSGITSDSFIQGGQDYYPTYVNNPIVCQLNFGPDATPGMEHAVAWASRFGTFMGTPRAAESSFNADRPDFDTWCMGHEIGHQHQNPINIESCGEASNNLFSCWVTHQTGYRMSRGGTFSQTENYRLTNEPFIHRDNMLRLRLYWNLFLYYHLAGRKPSFYPELYALLREQQTTPGYNSRRQSLMMNFYKSVCRIAHEDLTEYFRQWGFFIPVSDSKERVTLTQQTIDQAIREVKAMNYPENLQIMFIEDRCENTPRTDIHAQAGELKPEFEGRVRTPDYLHRRYGQLGMYTDYMPQNYKPATYTATLADGVITLQGQGGIGFIVRDKDGHVLLLSNQKSIPTSPIKTPDYTLSALDADGKETPVTVVSR